MCNERVNLKSLNAICFKVILLIASKGLSSGYTTSTTKLLTLDNRKIAILEGSWRIEKMCTLSVP